MGYRFDWGIWFPVVPHVPGNTIKWESRPNVQHFERELLIFGETRATFFLFF